MSLALQAFGFLLVSPPPLTHFFPSVLSSAEGSAALTIAQKAHQSYHEGSAVCSQYHVASEDPLCPAHFLLKPIL